MMTLADIEKLALDSRMPTEDLLFITLNIHGVAFKCEFNRMRMGLRLAQTSVFRCAKEQGELLYYFALPINAESPFSVNNEVLRLGDVTIGEALESTEDICDSHYMRRRGTSLNINPNSRTSCRGCSFCYTAYQVPYDRNRVIEERDLVDFFETWMQRYQLTSLAHLIQISVVTGCYANGDDVCMFLCRLRRVSSRYGFRGRIFYLGSQVNSEELIARLRDIAPVGICFSLEAFERRHLLKAEKRSLETERARELMRVAMGHGYEVNFSYIVGMESIEVIEKHLTLLRNDINKFPTFNVLQLHKHHTASLRDKHADELPYYIDARKTIESLFKSTTMRPLVWEDYRSLWYLKFADEPLTGIRFPW